MLISSPPTTPVDTQDANGVLQPPSEGWRQYFVAVFNICNALTQAGPTSQRPVKLLWVGRPFFDQTLGIPIFLKSAKPSVWINAAGAAV